MSKSNPCAPLRLKEFQNATEYWQSLYSDLQGENEIPLPFGVCRLLERYVFLLCSVEEMEDKIHGHELQNAAGKQVQNPLIDVMITYNRQLLTIGTELGIGVFSDAKAQRQKAIANGEEPRKRVGGAGSRKSALLDFTARQRQARIATDEDA